MPHFTVQTSAGATVAYSSIWQRKHLVLIALAQMDSAEASRYLSRVEELMRPVEDDTALVVTRDGITGLQAPAVAVADRWGEIAHVVQAARDGDLPAPDDLMEWVEHVRQRCPECEGESR